MRKYESKKRKLSAESNCASTTAMGSINAPPKRPKKIDFWNVVPNPVGITNSMQSDHIAELHKEFQKPPTRQDQTKIRELMNSTYELRRKDILTTVIPVKEIIEKYPPLATINGVRYIKYKQKYSI